MRGDQCKGRAWLQSACPGFIRSDPGTAAIHRERNRSWLDGCPGVAGSYAHLGRRTIPQHRARRLPNARGLSHVCVQRFLRVPIRCRSHCRHRRYRGHCPASVSRSLPSAPPLTNGRALRGVDRGGAADSRHDRIHLGNRAQELPASRDARPLFFHSAREPYRSRGGGRCDRACSAPVCAGARHPHRGRNARRCRRAGTGSSKRDRL